MVKKRGRPRKETKSEVSKEVPKSKIDEKAKLFETILADPRLPTEEEFKTGGRDILRNHYEINRDYGAEMSKVGLGITGLMKEKSASKR